MSEFIANKNRVITIIPGGTWIPGTPTYTDIEASKANADGAKILVDNISWTMAGCASAPPLPPAALVSGSGNIQSSAVKCKCDGKSVMRNLDNGSCSGSLQPAGAPPPTPIPCNCNFQITVPGQIKDRAE